MACIFWGLSYQATGPQLKTTRLQLVCGTPLAGPAHAGKHDQRTQPKRDNQNDNRNNKDLASSSVHDVTPFPSGTHSLPTLNWPSSQARTSARIKPPRQAINPKQKDTHQVCGCNKNRLPPNPSAPEMTCEYYTAIWFEIGLRTGKFNVKNWPRRIHAILETCCPGTLFGTLS